jgi:hypothetical protein
MHSILTPYMEKGTPAVFEVPFVVNVPRSDESCNATYPVVRARSLTIVVVITV